MVYLAIIFCIIFNAFLCFVTYKYNFNSLRNYKNQSIEIDAKQDAAALNALALRAYNADLILDDFSQVVENNLILKSLKIIAEKKKNEIQDLRVNSKSKGTIDKLKLVR